MNPLPARYFDGKRSIRHEVSLVLAGSKLKLIGRETSAEFDARKVRVAPRIGNTPRWLYLPGGGACAIADNDAVDSFARERRFPRLLHRLESRPSFAAVAVALVVLSLWLLIDRGLPVVAEQVAQRIPREAETALGEQTLAGLEQHWMQPSQLAPARRKVLEEKYQALARASGATPPPRLEFRASPVIGANAFALPGGVIVVTDELVKLSRNDDDVLAVLAHELGHVSHRHVMRQLLQGSATALVIAAVTGDIASASSLAASAPVVMVQMRYSREHEREADRFAIEVLQKTQIGPHHLAIMLSRLEASHKGQRGMLPTFLSSHPPTEERKALALADDAKDAQEIAQADADIEYETENQDRAGALGQAKPGEAAPRRSTPEPQPLAAVDAEQRRIVDLLAKRDFAELERVLGAYQAAFETDPRTSTKLENAFRSFARIPAASEDTLNAWIEREPASYVAAVARAAFYLRRGIDARGAQYINDTPKEDLEAMRYYLRKAYADLDRSLGLTAKPYLSYRYLMTIARIGGMHNEHTLRYEQAVALAPASVETRLAHMASLEPRWGGSYEQMARFVEQSRPALEPADWNKLAARIPAYHGFESRQAKDFPKAMQYLDEAIRLGEDADILCERAYVLGEQQRYKEAFRDVGRALAQARSDRNCLARAVYLASQVDDLPEIIRIMDLVIEVDPGSASAYTRRGWSYQRQNKQELAFADYLAAAKLDDAWAQLQVGKRLWAGAGVKQDRNEALVWLQKAAANGNADARLSLSQARDEIARGAR